VNERIEELMRQAIFTIPDGVDFDIPDEFTDKFAELIVQECARVCSHVGVALSAEPAQNNFGTAQTCKMAIEKHFGVES
jgi:hypothetical protein